MVSADLSIAFGSKSLMVISQTTLQITAFQVLKGSLSETPSSLPRPRCTESVPLTGMHPLEIGAGERIRTPDRLITNCLIINKLLIILEQAISGTLSLNRFNSAGYYRQALVVKTGQCTGSVPRNASCDLSGIGGTNPIFL